LQALKLLNPFSKEKDSLNVQKINRLQLLGLSTSTKNRLL
jgi:hypothetical protein